MSHIVKYAVLRYSPSIIAGEAINLGVLISDEKSRQNVFYSTTKWARVEKFDDELDIPGIKQTMEDIKNDVEKPLLSLYRDFSIEKYSSNFMNELHFSEVLQIKCDDTDNCIEDIKKIYLRFDYEKTHRMSKNKELHFVKRLFEGNGIEYRLHEKRSGKFGVPINYDFAFDGYGIKYIRFYNKEISKMLLSIKAFAWECGHDDPSFTPIFIYSPDSTNEQNKKYMEMSLNILHEASKNVYSIDDADISNLLLDFNIKHSDSLLTNVQ